MKEYLIGRKQLNAYRLRATKRQRQSRREMHYEYA
jgi:hypothetical protein